MKSLSFKFPLGIVVLIRNPHVLHGYSSLARPRRAGNKKAMSLFKEVKIIILKKETFQISLLFEKRPFLLEIPL